jgi:hypothetical protein
MRIGCKYKIEDVDSITCPYCNKSGFKMLHWGHLKKLHNKTIDDVIKEFPNIPTMTKKESDRRSIARLKCDQKITETFNRKYGGVGFKSKELDKKTRDVLEERYGNRNIMKIEEYKVLFRGKEGIPSKIKNPERAMKISKAIKGKPSKLKGKTYLEIHGKEKAKKLIEDKKISGAIACSRMTNPSIPQLKLFELTKELYPNTILNYSVSYFCIDVAIIDKKIAIEYDGSYWHQNKEKDSIRQKEIEKLGWSFIRYTDYIPSKQELVRDIQTKK